MLPALLRVVPALTLTLALAAVLAAPGPARGQALCSEPVEPICATTIPATEPSAATDQGVARHRCLEDMETYRSKLGEYHACLKGSVANAEQQMQAAAEFVQCLHDRRPECRLRQ